MKKTVKNRIARETLSRFLGHSVLSAVLVLGWNVSTVFAISPSSGIEQVIGVTNTVTAALHIQLPMMTTKRFFMRAVRLAMLLH